MRESKMKPEDQQTLEEVNSRFSKLIVVDHQYSGKDMTIELNKVLAHELTHALQSCRGYPIDCIGDLKREMEARICSNECRNFDECIIMALASSCGRKCNDPAIILHGLTDLQKWFFDKTRKGKGRPGGFCDFFRKKIRKR